MTYRSMQRCIPRCTVVLVPLLALLLLPVPAVAAGPFVQTARLMANGEFSCSATPYCFGYTEALSADGNTALVGMGNTNRAAGADYADGAAFFFVRSGMTWTQQGGKIVNPNVATEGEFGVTVALSGDGNTALIGAFTRATFPSMAVHIYTRNSTTWAEQQVLRSGYSTESAVALSRDGNTALVGIYSIVAVVYVRNGTTWSQQQVLVSGPQFANFGASVALSGDGNTALIGAWRDNDVGAAYVFTRSGTTWTQQGKLTGTEQRADCSTSYCALGWSVALSDDGNTALIGEPEVVVTGGTANGVAYVFTRSGAAWSQQQRLTGTDSVPICWFGGSVTLGGDGNTALIGAYCGGPGGRAYLFTRSGTTWSQQQVLTGGNAPACIGSNVCEFGWAVELSGDASTALIGSPGDDDGMGAAYVFTDTRSLTGIAVSGTTPLKVGQVAQFAATGTFNDATSGPLQWGTWQSSNPNVATVDASGNVTGQTAGTATITYTLDGVVGQRMVTVTAPNPIGLTLPSGRASGATSGSGAPSPAPAGRTGGASPASGSGAAPNPLPAPRP